VGFVVIWKSNNRNGVEAGKLELKHEICSSRVNRRDPCKLLITVAQFVAFGIRKASTRKSLNSTIHSRDNNIYNPASIQ
jgi:hypothetical protein